MPQTGDVMVDDYIRMERAGIDMVKEIMAVQTSNEEFRKLEIDVFVERQSANTRHAIADCDGSKAIATMHNCQYSYNL